MLRVITQVREVTLSATNGTRTRTKKGQEKGTTKALHNTHSAMASATPACLSLDLSEGMAHMDSRARQVSVTHSVSKTCGRKRRGTGLAGG